MYTWREKNECRKVGNECMQVFCVQDAARIMQQSLDAALKCQLRFLCLRALNGLKANSFNSYSKPQLNHKSKDLEIGCSSSQVNEHRKKGTRIDV